MKQKTKHLSKTTMSILLALVLVVSTLAVGIVSTSAAYLNGKPNTEANAADVAGDDAVGAKAPEAVGANACESVGSPDNAGGESGYSIYFKSKNGTSYDVEYYNAYNVNITVNVADLKLDDTSKLKFKVKSYKSGESDVWWGNDNVVNSPGSNTTLANNNENGGYFKNANNYTSITLKLKKDGNNLNMYWVSGVSTAHTITYGSVSGGSFASNKPTSANSGSSVSVTVQPDPGYQLDTFTVTNDSNNQSVSTSGSGNTRNFTMPSANVTVSATFSQINYTVETGTLTHCSITSLSAATAHYGDTITFNVNPETNYAIQSVKFTPDGGSAQDCTPGTGNQYSFTMPAANVTISAVCVTTSGTATVYFKSASAWVYHPFIKVGNSEEIEMTVDRELTNSTNGWKAKSKTGSLKYYWYKAELNGIDATRATTLSIRLQDTFVDITDSFNISDGASLYLACDDLMYGNELVDLSSYNVTDNANKLSVLDFYDTPLHMVANATDIASLDP